MINPIASPSTPTHPRQPNYELKLLRVCEQLERSRCNASALEALAAAFDAGFFLLVIEFEERIVNKIRDSNAVNLTTLAPIIAPYLKLCEEIRRANSS
jgi:hypothetical protein